MQQRVELLLRQFQSLLWLFKPPQRGNEVLAQHIFKFALAEVELHGGQDGLPDAVLDVLGQLCKPWVGVQDGLLFIYAAACRDAAQHDQLGGNFLARCPADKRICRLLHGALPPNAQGTASQQRMMAGNGCKSDFYANVGAVRTYKIGCMVGKQHCHGRLPIDKVLCDLAPAANGTCARASGIVDIFP